MHVDVFICKQYEENQGTINSFISKLHIRKLIYQSNFREAEAGGAKVFMKLFITAIV